MATVEVPIATLKSQVHRACAAVGYRDADARVLAEIMCFAELHGNNQGISKLYEPSTGLGHNTAEGPLIVERESAHAAVVNGNKRAGMVAMCRAMELAAAKAKAGGVAITGTRNTYTSTPVTILQRTFVD